MRKIYLSGNKGFGKYALVDDEDFELLNSYKWNLFGIYAARGPKKSEVRSTIFMHRMLIKVPKGMQTDHINGNGLDNQKHNLRVATASMNCVNRPPSTKGISNYRGVIKHINGWWRARIELNGKKIHLGLFRDPKEAAKAYNEAAKKYHGEFARLNII